MAMIPSFASIVHERYADASRNRARRSAHGPATELHAITKSEDSVRRRPRTPVRESGTEPDGTRLETLIGVIAIGRVPTADGGRARRATRAQTDETGSGSDERVDLGDGG